MIWKSIFSLPCIFHIFQDIMFADVVNDAC